MFRTVTDPITPASGGMVLVLPLHGEAPRCVMYETGVSCNLSVQLAGGVYNSLYVIIDCDRRNVVYR